MNWRLGLDLGAGSLGWCALALGEEGQPAGILAAGSRIFGDGRAPARGEQAGTPLAVERRTARAMRRRRDRYQRRRTGLLRQLTTDGLFPEEPEARLALQGLDPFELRARALDQPLSPHEIGRAFFHLNQRRGFKSNRKADRGTDKETGKIAVGIDRLRTAIEASGARTFGEFLHLRRRNAPDQNRIPSVRTRLRPEPGEGAKGDGYDFYPGRALIEEEFEAIWEAQRQFHPDRLTEAVHDRLHEIVFHQRPLKEPKVGTCTLVPGETRLRKAHPLFQKRRLLEEVNALLLVRTGETAQRLTREQRDLLYLRLKDKQKVSFETLRTRVLKLDPSTRFNKESESRSDLKGDEVAALLGDRKRFGTAWAPLPAERQWAVVERLLDVETDEEAAALQAWLQQEHDLPAERAAAVVAAAGRLPQGYGRFGETATRGLIAALEAEVIVYSEAVVKAGFGHHSDFRDGEVHAELPYYGAILERHILPGTGDPADPEELRVGRLTNPTVHIGLNQLRRVVNALIRTHGRPAEIAIELARELKLDADEKARRSRENAKNRIEAEKRSQKLQEIGQRDTGANRNLLKLWEELNPDNVLDRRCVYSGRQISIDMLFNGSTEVDHILPFDATLDDSNGNRILCLREANRDKRKRSPFEAWGHTDRWPEIAERAARLPREKRWRFEPDAMKRFADLGGFHARHLTDTQYLSRLSREYLSALYPEKGEGSSHVWVSPGRLTEMVRRKLGLNDLLPDHNIGGGAEHAKNRLDHRHHTIDAAVVAVVDRGLLNEMARASGQEGRDGAERVIVPEPWPGFREDLRRAVNAIVVSHRPDHGTASKAGLPRGRDQTAGKLHNDTAYGLTGEADGRDNQLVVHRVPLGALKPGDLDRVRDCKLRKALQAFTAGREGKEFERAVARFAEVAPPPFRGLRRVRVLEPLSVIPIRDADGRAYKGYKGDSNYRYDVWELPDGRWVAEVVSMFDAHQPGWTSAIRADCPTARKVLRLHRDDVLAIERTGERELVRVVKFRQTGQLTLAAPEEAGDLKKRDAASDQSDPFKYLYAAAGTLRAWKARQVRLDELGRVFDPGPRSRVETA